MSIEIAADDSFLYKIRCVQCEGRPGVRWGTYRSRDDNGFLGAMDRWAIHLAQKHPGVQAECLQFLDQALARLQERNPRG